MVTIAKSFGLGLDEVRALATTPSPLTVELGHSAFGNYRDIVKALRATMHSPCGRVSLTAHSQGILRLSIDPGLVAEKA